MRAALAHGWQFHLPFGTLGSPYTLHPTPSSTQHLHPTPYTLHSSPCTLHPAPYTLHPTLCTLHCTSHTLHPAPYTLKPLNPNSYTLHQVAASGERGG